MQNLPRSARIKLSSGDLGKYRPANWQALSSLKMRAQLPRHLGRHSDGMAICREIRHFHGVEKVLFHAPSDQPLMQYECTPNINNLPATFTCWHPELIWFSWSESCLDIRLGTSIPYAKNTSARSVGVMAVAIVRQQ